MDKEVLNTNSQEVSNISLQTEAEPLLKTAAKWGQFLAILGFIGCGFLILAAIFMFFGYSMMPIKNPMETFGAIFSVVMGFMYIILAILYFFPSNYLYKFSNKTLNALRNRNTDKLTHGFANLKSCFKFLGIMSIITIAIYVIIFIVALVAGFSSAN